MTEFQQKIAIIKALYFHFGGHKIDAERMLAYMRLQEGFPIDNLFWLLDSLNAVVPALVETVYSNTGEYRVTEAGVAYMNDPMMPLMEAKSKYELQKAYRALVKTSHIDSGGDGSNTSEINLLYARLGKKFKS